MLQLYLFEQHQATPSWCSPAESVLFNTNSIYILVQKKSRKAAMEQRHKEYNWTVLYMQMV